MRKKLELYIIFILVLLYSILAPNYSNFNDFMNDHINYFNKNTYKINIDTKFIYKNQENILLDMKNFKIVANKNLILYYKNMRNKNSSFILLRNLVPNKINKLSIKIQNSNMAYKIDNKKYYSSIRITNNLDPQNYKGSTNLYISYKKVSNINYSLIAIIIILSLFIISIRNLKFDKKISNMTYNKNTHNQLLSIRSIACISVFLFHAKFEFLAIGQNLNKLSFSFLLNASGYMAVFIFFILSGFLMGKNFLNGKYHLNRDGIIKFYKNRMVQIFPLYYIIVVVIAITTNSSVLYSENIDTLIRYITFTNIGVFPYGLNGVFWSIATEILFYALSPFLTYGLYLLVKKYSFYKILFAILLLSVISRTIMYYLVYDQKDFYIIYIYRPFFTNIDLFLFGILANFAVDKFVNILKTPPNWLINLLIFILFAFANFTFTTNWQIEAYINTLGVVLIEILMLLIISLVEIRGIKIKNENKLTLLRRLGIYTFCIYAWHALILVHIKQPINSYNISLISKILIILAICILVGIMFYYLVERPVCKMYKKSVIKDEFKE